MIGGVLIGLMETWLERDRLLDLSRRRGVRRADPHPARSDRPASWARPRREGLEPACARVRKARSSSPAVVVAARRPESGLRARLRRFPDQPVLRAHHQSDRHQHHAGGQPESDQRSGRAVLDRPRRLHGGRRLHGDVRHGLPRRADRGARWRAHWTTPRDPSLVDGDQPCVRGCAAARGRPGCRHSVAAAAGATTWRSSRSASPRSSASSS